MKPAKVVSVSILNTSSFVCTELSEISTVVSPVSIGASSLNRSAFPW